jgi:hypothetical protein
MHTSNAFFVDRRDYYQHTASMLFNSAALQTTRTYNLTV